MDSSNIVICSNAELTLEEKSQFGYFGEGAKISPPMKIINPHRIHIGDKTSIQSYCHIAAFQDLRVLKSNISAEHESDFSENEYLYDSKIIIGNVNLIGRFFYVACTKSIVLEEHILISERVFITDHNPGHDHPQVPIMQQPYEQGSPVAIGAGSWIGAGASILKGSQIGRYSVIGTNSVCQGSFAEHSVIGTAPAKLLYRTCEPK